MAGRPDVAGKRASGDRKGIGAAGALRGTRHRQVGRDLVGGTGRAQSPMPPPNTPVVGFGLHPLASLSRRAFRLTALDVANAPHSQEFWQGVRQWMDQGFDRQEELKKLRAQRDFQLAQLVAAEEARRKAEEEAVAAEAARLAAEEV